ncbi:hypothetical protein Tco_0386880 [Tanacetum coccineum]
MSANCPYFQEGCDAVGKAGISALVKCTSAIRQLAYAVVPDSLDEYLQIGEKTSRDCLMHFCNGVIVNMTRSICEGYAKLTSKNSCFFTRTNMGFLLEYVADMSCSSMILMCGYVLCTAIALFSKFCGDYVLAHADLSVHEPIFGLHWIETSSSTESTLWDTMLCMDISEITRKRSKSGKHRHEKRKSTREAKDSKPKPRKVNYGQVSVKESQTWVKSRGFLQLRVKMENSSDQEQDGKGLNQSNQAPSLVH